jgi:hypothetical protein
MAVTPLDYLPRINPPEDYVGPPTDPEDERIEVGVVIVGGGPAGGRWSLPSRSALLGLHCLGELRQDLVEVADDAEV